MGPVLDLKERNETTMEASTSKDNAAFVSMAKDKNMKPESKHKGKFDTGISFNEQDADVSKSKNGNDGASVQPQSGDSTASSSSFSDTDVGGCELESDNEVMSDFRGDLCPVRKKRVTSHWRKFVQPLMWRCKWAELQLRKFQSMAHMYDKEIEKHNQTKQLKYKNHELEAGCAKSIPFFPDPQREKLMKRKKRKRHDDGDPEMYMSQHNLFSYFAACRSPANGPTMDDDQTNLGPSSPKNVGNEFRVPDELLSLEFREDYSLEQILWKIEVSQSQVSEMKNKLNTIMTENSERILSTEDIILHESSNALPNAVKEPDYPTNMEGQSVVATFASQLIKLNTGDDMVNTDDLVKDDNAAFEGTCSQDANKPEEESPVYSRKRNTDGILIYNRRSKKPQTDSGDVKVHPVENLQAPVEQNSNIAPVSEDSTQNEQTGQKIRSVTKLSSPKNKRKRAARTRRNNGSSLWTRRTSG